MQKVGANARGSFCTSSLSLNTPIAITWNYFYHSPEECSAFYDMWMDFLNENDPCDRGECCISLEIYALGCVNMWRLGVIPNVVLNSVGITAWR
jgi:hypothetical protein